MVSKNFHEMVAGALRHQQTQQPEYSDGKIRDDLDYLLGGLNILACMQDRELPGGFLLQCDFFPDSSVTVSAVQLPFLSLIRKRGCCLFYRHARPILCFAHENEAVHLRAEAWESFYGNVGSNLHEDRYRDLRWFADHHLLREALQGLFAALISKEPADFEAIWNQRAFIVLS